MARLLKVGWVGLGAMGAPMSLAVAHAGHSVRAFDTNPAALDAVAHVVTPAESLREVARNADAVVIMVATGAQLEMVLFGQDGIAEALSADTCVMIMATVGPDAVDRAASRLTQYTAHVIDAPVSGGAKRAATGDLLVMVSGATEDIERVGPLLDAVASNHPVVGSRPGDGQRFKVVNQLLCGVHIAAAGEALALADSMGLDVEQCHRVLTTGAAHSFMFDDRGERMVAGDFDRVTSALNIFVKDMGLVTEAARQVNQPVPLAAAAEQLYVRGRREGLGLKDDSVVYQILKERE